MKGYVEVIRNDLVKGWALDKEHPETSPRIRVMLGETAIAEEAASVDWPDVDKALGVPAARCGFRLKVDLASEDLDEISVQAFSPAMGRSQTLPFT
jgi:hypothetical protein